MNSPELLEGIAHPKTLNSVQREKGSQNKFIRPSCNPIIVRSKILVDFRGSQTGMLFGFVLFF